VNRFTNSISRRQFMQASKYPTRSESGEASAVRPAIRPDGVPAHSARPIAQLSSGNGYGGLPDRILNQGELLELAASVAAAPELWREHVAFAEARAPYDELVPGQLGQPAVHDLERRPACTVVEQPVGIEPRHDGGLVGQALEGGRGSRPGVHPAVERRDQRWCDEIARIDE